MKDKSGKEHFYDLDGYLEAVEENTQADQEDQDIKQAILLSLQHNKFH